MMAQLIDGKKIAHSIKNELKEEIKKITKSGHRAPGLAVVIVGNDPASHVYVAHKKKACEKIGIKSEVFKLTDDIAEDDIVALVAGLNDDPHIDGILVQLPLPKPLNSDRIIGAIATEKDVDGLGVSNQGFLALSKPMHVPCTREVL